MADKRITILAGHYGSGKTNIAVNLAFLQKQQGKDVRVCDLDIVNPYFRTKDSLEDFRHMGIPLISSEYANSNVDIPALPQEMYSVLDNKEANFIVDVGGDDRGALALGRLSPGILEENRFEMLMVANFYRPLTRDVRSLKEVMEEIQVAAGLPFTGLVNNSNLGEETTAEDVVSTQRIALEAAQTLGLPLVMTCVKEELYSSLEGKIESLFSLKLQEKYYK